MKTVLIVDDDVNIGRLFDYALQKAGFSVMVARDGSQGLALAIKQPPDVAVLDVMMPGVHGYELCRRLRANPQTAHIKIVFLTARTQPVDEQEAMRAGADRFLSKPVMPGELVDEIESLLALEREEVSLHTRPLPGIRQRRTAESEPEAKSRGRLVACFSPSPGVGVTTLSVNLSLAFALLLRAKVPLVELHATQGSVLPAFGLGPESLRGNLRAAGEDLSWDTLLQHLVNHPSGVRILPGPPPDSEVPPVLSRQALSILLSRFPLVLTDTSSEPDTRVQSALLTADLILLMTTPEPPVLRAVAQLIQALRSLEYPNQQILLVVNNVRPKPDISIEQIRKGMRRPVFGIIPHEPRMKEMIRAGQPLLIAEPRSAVAQAIGRMSTQIAQGFRLIASA
ncbi:MAG: response regulator [Anaerolineae bacterium]|nr:response regulator [Anaerolineae bacterium]